ncbi:MAG: ATP synthase F1 subunit delta [Balneolaceae bacterium]
MNSKAARRYAKAFLESAIELNKLDLLKEDIELIRNTAAESKSLRSFLRSPIVKNSDKKAALHTIFEDRISEETGVLLDLLMTKNRISLLQEICSAFVVLYEQHVGIINVEVYTAYELQSAQVDELRAMLSSVTGKKVQLNITTQKELIGGLAVKVDDTIVDGTVKYKLNQLRNQFAADAA